MSWKIVHVLRNNCFPRSSSLWGCELKNSWWFRTAESWLSSSLWGCELKIPPSVDTAKASPSSSLWGCELKNLQCLPLFHPLLRHPPCEDVSWKDELRGEPKEFNGHPPCEDVSWKKKQKYHASGRKRHPPCEDVSWKTYSQQGIHYLKKSSSLWGCELKNQAREEYITSKSHPPCEDVSWKVRYLKPNAVCSGHPPCEDVSWKMAVLELPDSSVVILLVRMWVEKWKRRRRKNSDESSSLWGCELKSLSGNRIFLATKSSSLWGCELKIIKSIQG